jgi:hypothetical protein
MSENGGKYKDMLDLPHHVSAERKHMPLLDRAAQFAPFAALTGFEDDVEEKERLTDEFIDLAEDELNSLNERFSQFLDRIGERPDVILKVFEQDSRKEGGKVVQIRGRIKRFDEIERMLYFADGKSISLDNIVDIGEIK